MQPWVAVRDFGLYREPNGALQAEWPCLQHTVDGRRSGLEAMPVVQAGDDSTRGDGRIAGAVSSVRTGGGCGAQTEGLALGSHGMVLGLGKQI